MFQVVEVQSMQVPHVVDKRVMAETLVSGSLRRDVFLIGVGLGRFFRGGLVEAR